MARYKDRDKARRDPRKWAKAKPEEEKYFDQLTAVNQQESPLLRLPREPREETVRLALLGLSRLNSRWAMDPPISALIGVCRQLRAETAPIYFANTVIYREEDKEDKGYFRGFDHTYKKYIRRMALSDNCFGPDPDLTAAIARAATLDAATSLRPGTWVVMALTRPSYGYYNGLEERITDLKAVFRGKDRKYRQDRARESVLANLAAAPPSVVRRVESLLAKIYDKITARNQQECSLLRLPRELRDEIIKMALPLSYEVGHPYTYFPVKKALLPALLSVCR
ncbi:hypothetical protein Slin15195_G037790 [Septoria linicola]|uniref:Uncharacterized protein n=1 Tax=Septoria linicola TaxID=215465 RepID=A0A9Q9EGX9_9PEZI|nr:hypothetical protein Slin15195_G037790 [Septoria linicola]